MSTKIRRILTAIVLIVAFLVLTINVYVFFVSFGLAIGFCINEIITIRKQVSKFLLADILLAILYFAPAAVAAVDLRVEFIGGLFLVVFGTAINDSAPYLVGSKYGKTPFFSKISPNKTREGFMAGLIATLLFFVYFGAFNPWNILSVYQSITLGILIVMFGTFGDLLASYFKRKHGVKDFGTALGSHGGFMDRMDSHIITLPVSLIFFYSIGLINII